MRFGGHRPQLPGALYRTRRFGSACVPDMAALTTIGNRDGQERTAMMDSQSNGRLWAGVHQHVMSRSPSTDAGRTQGCRSGELSPAWPLERSLSSPDEASCELRDQPANHSRSLGLTDREHAWYQPIRGCTWVFRPQASPRVEEFNVFHARIKLRFVSGPVECDTLYHER